MSGFCTRKEMKHCIREQDELRDTGAKVLLGEIMLRRGILNFDEVNQVLHTQHFTEMQQTDRAIARLAVLSGFVKVEEVRDCFARQDRAFNTGRKILSLTEMLITDGKISSEDAKGLTSE